MKLNRKNYSILRSHAFPYSSFIFARDKLYILLLVYVDDILITDNDDVTIKKLTIDLNAQFALKQLGSLHYFFGSEVVRDSTRLYLSQQKYVADISLQLNMTGVKPCLYPVVKFKYFWSLEMKLWKIRSFT